MDLKHEKCGGEILAEISSAVQFLGMLEISNRSSLSCRSIIINHRSRELGLDLICKGCGDNLDLDNQDTVSEIHAICYACGENFQIGELSIPSASTGVFCESCAGRYEEDGETLSGLQEIIVNNRIITI